MVSLNIDPPPSRHGAAQPGRAARRVVFFVGLLAVLGAGVWIGRVTAPTGSLPVGGSGAPATAAGGAPSTAASSAPAAVPEGAPAASGEVAPAPVAPAAAPAPGDATAAGEPAGAPPAGGNDRRRLSATVSGALEDSIARALAPADRVFAEQLTAVVNRLLVWDMRVARDGRKGDTLEVVWSPPRAAAPGLPPTGEPVVEAVRYVSSKLGATFASYRFQPEGARWPRYFRADGTELEARLVDGPISEYEQVTSLLRDGRRHKGVDFKTPVGSPVLAPFDGVVERRNWNFAGNGNCLDVRDPATGRHAIFLHLDVLPKEMQPGRRVKRGEVIASSGNSGRSYAPHLHYQLEDAAGRVLDPFAVHRTDRRSLPAAQKAAFDAARGSLEVALGGVARGG